MAPLAIIAVCGFVAIVASLLGFYILSLKVEEATMGSLWTREDIDRLARDVRRIDQKLARILVDRYRPGDGEGDVRRGSDRREEG